MAYLANRSVTQRNAAVVASTLTGSTITTSVMTASTLTGSTITASVMGFSTLTGSTITTSVLGFSTLTGSSIIGTSGQIGSLGYSTLSGSSIVGTMGQISSLGIGTASPQSALDVNGVISVGTGANVGGQGININTGWLNPSNYYEWAPLKVSVRSTPVFNVTTQGYVGIGTTSPMNRIHIHSAVANSDPGITITHSTTTGVFTCGLAVNVGSYAGNAVAGDAIFRNDDPSKKVHLLAGTGNAVMTITSSSVGIGATNPSEALEVRGNIRLGPNSDHNADYYIRSGGQLCIHANDGSTQDDQYIGLILQSGKTSGLGKITVWGSTGNSNYQHIEFTTQNVERMRITGSGNVGIGTTNPSAPLHIRASGTSNPAINGIYVYNTSNTAGEDAIITMRTGGTSGGNPYISWDIANELGWSMGIDNADDNKLKISAVWNSLTSATKLVVNTSGNVGIGTTNPFSALTIVNGESIYIGNSTASAFRFHHNTLNQSFLDFGSGDLFIRTATGVGTEVNRLVITSGGNVGIGTTNPSAPLTVNGNIYQNIVDNTVFTIDAGNLGRLGFFKQGGTFPKIVASSTSPIAFSHLSSGDLTTASSSSTVNDRMIIDSSGNVGIGTTSPGYTLDVVGSIKASNTLHATYYSAPDQRSLTNYLKPVSQPAGTFTAGFYGGTATGYGDGIHFNTYVDASGGKQNLVLFAKDTIGMRIYQGDWQSSSSYSTYMDAVMANSSGNVGIGTATPGAYKLYVQGDIYASGNITGLSDRRFKTNIEPLVGALDAVTALNGYTYFRPDHRPEERQMGLIAQEVQEVYPEAVTYDKENDRYGVNYGAMIAPLVQAMKEMRSEYCAQINHLKEEISSLKARLSV